MSKSRILGADMTLLFSLCFLINKTRGIKATGRFYKFFILNRVFFSFLGQIIHTLQAYGSVRLFISELFTTPIPYSWLLLNFNKQVKGEN